VLEMEDGKWFIIASGQRSLMAMRWASSQVVSWGESGGSGVRL
jgi:hypothetical protein